VSLCLFSPVKASNQVSVVDVQAVADNLLQVLLMLDISEDLNVALSVDVALSLLGNNGLIFAGTTPAYFQGTAGETTTAYLHVDNANLLTADVAVNVQLGNLLALNLDVDVDLSGIGLGNLVGNLLNGVLQIVDGLLGGLLNGLLGGLFGPQAAQIQVANVQNLGNGVVRANFQLANAVQGGVSANVNIQLLNAAGVVIYADVQALVFSGVAGQIVSVDLDVSAAIDLFGCGISIQVSLDAVILGIIDLNIHLAVDLSGLNNLLDGLLGALLGSQQTLACNQGSSYFYTTDYSTYTSDYSSYTSDYSTNAATA